MEAVCLISGGIDSPVAAKMMMDEGVEVVFLHSVINEESREKVEGLVNELNEDAELHFINHKEFLETVQQECNKKYTCVLCKRRMYREAEELCEEVNADYIITGESIGQVASQTVENLKVLDQAVSIPVIRPLIGLNKQKIINFAKKYNTYELSIKKRLKCPFVPNKPSTRADLKVILNEERKLKV